MFFLLLRKLKVRESIIMAAHEYMNNHQICDLNTRVFWYLILVKFIHPSGIRFFFP